MNETPSANEPLPPPEMPRPVSIRHLPADGLQMLIEAEAIEREALVARLDLEAMNSLQASVRVETHGSPDVIAVRGELTAILTRSCVVSLEPFEANIWLPFERLFTTGAVPAEDEITIDPALLDLEPLTEDWLDIGEIVVEELAVNLDPYPRAPGQEASAEDAEQDDHASPFAALASLRSRKEDEG